MDRHRIPLEQYAGHVPTPFAVYRAPVVGLIAALTALGMPVGAVAPMLGIAHLTAVELREQAAAKFKSAADLVEGKSADEISGDVETQFNALMDEAKSLDAAYVKAAGTEGRVANMRERLDYYSQQATGSPIPWSRTAPASQVQPVVAKSMGQQFVESEQYADLLKSGRLASDNATFKTDPFRPEVKATTDVIYSGAGGGGALVVPQYLPGILGLPQRPLTVRQLFSQDTTTSDTLSYARQTSFDNGATTVAQATDLATGLKPQSSIGWTRVTSPIEAIATWMAATRRQLSDAGQTRALIDNQLTLMLKLVEEDQLLNGNGTSPNIRGLLATTGVQTLDLSAGTSSHANIDGIRDAMRLVRTGPAFADPTGVVMHPIDAALLDEAKDTTTGYLGQGPFGNAQDTVWRLPRVESLAIAEGHALVGGFKQGATVFEREGVVIMTSDSHSDFFIRNLVAVLGEERLGLAVFFPAAFVYVTFKTNGWGTA